MVEVITIDRFKKKNTRTINRLQMEDSLQTSNSTSLKSSTQRSMIRKDNNSNAGNVTGDLDTRNLIKIKETKSARDMREEAANQKSQKDRESGHITSNLGQITEAPKDLSIQTSIKSITSKNRLIDRINNEIEIANQQVIDTLKEEIQRSSTKTGKLANMSAKDMSNEIERIDELKHKINTTKKCKKQKTLTPWFNGRLDFNQIRTEVENENRTTQELIDDKKSFQENERNQNTPPRQHNIPQTPPKRDSEDPTSQSKPTPQISVKNSSKSQVEELIQEVKSKATYHKSPNQNTSVTHSVHTVTQPKCDIVDSTSPDSYTDERIETQETQDSIYDLHQDHQVSIANRLSICNEIKEQIITADYIETTLKQEYADNVTLQQEPIAKWMRYLTQEKCQILRSNKILQYNTERDLFMNGLNKGLNDPSTAAKIKAQAWVMSLVQTANSWKRKDIQDMEEMEIKRDNAKIYAKLKDIDKLSAIKTNIKNTTKLRQQLTACKPKK